MNAARLPVQQPHPPPTMSNTHAYPCDFFDSCGKTYKLAARYKRHMAEKHGTQPARPAAAAPAPRPADDGRGAAVYAFATILDHKQGAGGFTYLVQFKGLPPSKNEYAWTALAGLVAARRTVEAYHQQRSLPAPPWPSDAAPTKPRPPAREGARKSSRLAARKAGVECAK